MVKALLGGPQPKTRMVPLWPLQGSRNGGAKLVLEVILSIDLGTLCAPFGKIPIILFRYTSELKNIKRRKNVYGPFSGKVS
jgi:hypothetical protein